MQKKLAVSIVHDAENTSFTVEALPAGLYDSPIAGDNGGAHALSCDGTHPFISFARPVTGKVTVGSHMGVRDIGRLIISTYWRSGLIGHTPSSNGRAMAYRPRHSSTTMAAALSK
jgi:hypothetical protein